MPELNPDSLLRWYQAHKRDLPWRYTNDPYKIWISEVMLQQTRVDTVISYYHRFIEALPTIQSLAEADLQQVLKLWEGLGYYSRARNLHDAARTVVSRYNGTLPDTYDEITQLKGVGPYTAAAVLSIAFQKKHAVVDGNVIRVVTRFLGIEEDIRKASTQKLVREFVEEMIPAERPGDFNQAVMELGATICKPVGPLCSACPIAHNCVAGNSVMTHVIPYKSPAKKIPHHQIVTGLIVNNESKILISQRPEEKMLGGLWEFPGGKQESGETLKEALQRELAEELNIKATIFDRFKVLNHAYSHFRITLHAFWCRIDEGIPEPRSSTALRWVTPEEMTRFPFPTANKRILDELTQLNSGQLLKQFRK